MLKAFELDCKSRYLSEKLSAADEANEMILRQLKERFQLIFNIGIFPVNSSIVLSSVAKIRENVSKLKFDRDEKNKAIKNLRKLDLEDLDDETDFRTTEPVKSPTDSEFLSDHHIYHCFP